MQLEVLLFGLGHTTWGFGLKVHNCCFGIEVCD